MATRRQRFPETRAWVICNNFNERVVRAKKKLFSQKILRHQRPQPAWNQTARRIYRYVFYQIRETTLLDRRPVAPGSPWGLRIQGLIRELRRRNGDYRRRWQRRIFQILEVWSKPAKQHTIDKAWQSCAQILTSANHWRRRIRSTPVKPLTWTNVLWRAIHLNERKANPVEKPDWQVRYRVIAATRFRNRTLGWDRTYNQIIQSTMKA